METQRHQNILFITADQWRGDCLSLLGHPTVLTPHMDALAKEATVFTQHYTCAVPCGPSRTSLLTGLYPSVHRSVCNGTPLDARHSNVAKEVRKLGYDPILLGYTDTSIDPREVTGDDSRLKSYEGVMDGFRLEASFNESRLNGWLTELRRKGYTIPANHRDIYLPADGSHIFDMRPAVYRAEDSDSAYITDSAIHYLESQAGHEPWFIHAVYYRPHPPLIAPAPYNTQYDPNDLSLPSRCSSWEEEAQQHPYLAARLAYERRSYSYDARINTVEASDEIQRMMRAVYFGLISEVDFQIGRLLSYLKDTDNYDNTLIIVTSDHGEMLGEHWCWGKAGYFDSAMHIPLIIRVPEAHAHKGHQVDAFTESVDLVPTILNWLGAELPHECDGYSLLPWCQGKALKAWRTSVFWEYDFRTLDTYHNENALQLTPDQCTLNVIRDKHYKYVHFTALPPLLFDLQKDPGEHINLAQNPDYQNIVADYAGQLLSHRMLHAERTLTNHMLTPQGLVKYTGPRRRYG